MLLTFLAQTAEPSSGGGLSGIVFILPMILLFYFFMIRPQRRRMADHQQMVRAVQVGEEIETIAGVFGRVVDMNDELLFVEIAPGTTIKMSRSALRRRVNPEPVASEDEVPPDDRAEGP